MTLRGLKVEVILPDHLEILKIEPWPTMGFHALLLLNGEVVSVDKDLHSIALGKGRKACLDENLNAHPEFEMQTTQTHPQQPTPVFNSKRTEGRKHPAAKKAPHPFAPLRSYGCSGGIQIFLAPVRWVWLGGRALCTCTHFACTCTPKAHFAQAQRHSNSPPASLHDPDNWFGLGCSSLLPARQNWAKPVEYHHCMGGVSNWWPVGWMRHPQAMPTSAPQRQKNERRKEGKKGREGKGRKETKKEGKGRKEGKKEGKGREGRKEGKKGKKEREREGGREERRTDRLFQRAGSTAGKGCHPLTNLTCVHCPWPPFCCQRPSGTSSVAIKAFLKASLSGCARPSCNCPKVSSRAAPPTYPHPSLIFTCACWNGRDLN
ncbi:hypothetical protein L345_03988, partial [Ophiophagus hannah]